MKPAEEYYKKFYHMDEQAELTNSDIEIIQCMQEYASQFKKQLKEKEEEIEELKDTNNKFHERINIDREVKESLKLELQASNEMNERLETYIQEWLSVCGKTSEQVLDKYQSIKLANTTAVLLTIKEFLTEYQNSKK